MYVKQSGCFLSPANMPNAKRVIARKLWIQDNVPAHTLRVVSVAQRL